MKSIVRPLCFIAIAAAGGAAFFVGQKSTPTEAQAHSWLAECTLNFDNDFATQNILRQCRDSFCSETKLNSAGALVSCGSDDFFNCWVWRERCGSRGYVKFWPSAGWTHLHMFWDNPAIDDTAADGNPGCFCNDPGDGLGGGFSVRNTNGTCSRTCPNYKTENRDTIRTHDSTGIMRVWVEDSTSGTRFERVFDVARVYVEDRSWTDPHSGEVKQPSHMAFWGLTANGWLGWQDLPPGNWDVSADMHDITAVEIETTPGFGTPAALREIVVRN